jgi:hypothetical protein
MHVLYARSVAVVHDDGVGEEDERRIVTGPIGRVIGRGASVYRTRQFYVGVWAQSFSFISFLCSNRRAWQ